MLLSELRQKAQQGLLDFAWRQWAQAGVSANRTGLDRWAIDPEALIIFTIEVARHDPRLFDEVLDWLALNRRLLSMQRLRNLAIRFSVDLSLLGAVLASVGEPVSSSQWPRSRQREGRGLNDEKRVFSPDVLGFIGEPDPIFAEYGYVRPRVARSGKSSEPDVQTPANFAFKLRNLFGPGSRSEVMRILLTLTDVSLDAARISDEAGFAKRNVSDTLAGLVASRVVKARWAGNERLYLAYRAKWANLLEVGPSADSLPGFVSWVHLLPASLAIFCWLGENAESTDSGYLISSRARDLMEHVTADLEMANITTSLSRSLPGESFLPAFMTTLESLLAKLEPEKDGGGR